MGNASSKLMKLYSLAVLFLKCRYAVEILEILRSLIVNEYQNVWTVFISLCKVMLVRSGKLKGIIEWSHVDDLPQETWFSAFLVESQFYISCKENRICFLAAADVQYGEALCFKHLNNCIKVTMKNSYRAISFVFT